MQLYFISVCKKNPRETTPSISNTIFKLLKDLHYYVTQSNG